MKKKLFSLLTGLFVLLSACAGEEAEPEPSFSAESVPEEEATLPETVSAPALEETARRLSEEMAGGTFSGCTALFTEALGDRLDEAALRAAWEQVTVGAGELIGFHDLSKSEKNGSATVITTLAYTNTGVTVSLVFDETGAVEGIWLNTRALPTDGEGEYYREIPITVGEYRLDGLLTLPKNAEAPPVVILIQGSGQSDLNETIGSARPFRDLALGLAERGIASIRFHKRFFQRPELAGTPEDVTIETEVLADVRAAIALAREDERLGEGIFLLGHSLGGMLAPAIAAEDADVRGVISLAGSPRRLEDIIKSQYEDALREAGTTADEEAFAEAMSPVIAAAEKIKSLDEDDGGEYFGASAAYWRSLNQIDGADAARSLGIPLLFLQGSEDVQIRADLDFAEWKALLAGKPNCRFRQFDGLGHLFTDESGTVAPTVIEEIAEFVLSARE